MTRRARRTTNTTPRAAAPPRARYTALLLLLLAAAAVRVVFFAQLNGTPLLALLPPHADVLVAAAGIWYSTVERARTDPAYRDEVVRQCIQMAERAQRAQWLDPDEFRSFFTSAASHPFELLAAKPSELTEAITSNVFVNVLQLMKTEKSTDTEAVIRDLRRTVGERIVRVPGAELIKI